MEDQNLAREVAVLRERLMQAQRMVALGELVSTVTHEFNNVLTTIINYAKLGLRHNDPDTRQKAFEKILAAGTRAARITNGVLAMARNRSVAKEPVNFATLIEDTLLLLERELNKYRIAVDLQLRPVPPVLAHPGQIQQLLLNLIINARQAMPRGGRLVIKLGYDSDTRMVELVIRDYGCGIPSELLPRIFEPFFTTKDGSDGSGKGGTGLGLALCREIVETHGGRIRVESTVGVGTAFIIRFPAAEEASLSSAVYSGPQESPATCPEISTTTE
ncbi:MAG: ATP-binding protein [Thermoguttaceae bacterium]|nr:ATP-binding protein [Thermoguttaceae bacterium]MDW8078803.1 ATP-binding protein [Thermoguttaceae bacterium]